MFEHLLTQLTRSLGVFIRTFRAFFQRRVIGLVSRLRRLTNFSRHATKIATDSLNAAVTVAQKPTRREDYVETRRLFIAKSLILKIIIVVIALGLIGYFLVWPFLLSHFFTAKYYVKDSKLEDWSGRVIVYSDEKKTVPLYSGRLTDGVLQGEGKQYDEEGLLSYEGSFVNGQRSGAGKAYQNGVLRYEGQFANNVFEGSGTAYDEDGTILYSGQFSAGVYSGRGKGYEKGELYYEGAYTDGLAEGDGIRYYPSGKTAYKGHFEAGEPDGTGSAYTEDGRMVYSGGFSAGNYSGEGVLYPAAGQELSASFLNNEPAGVVRWKKDGYLWYEGEWSNGAPAGFGKLYNRTSKVIYAGQFSGGTLDGAWLLGLGTEELREALGEGRTVTGDGAEGGFLLTARELGLTALCSYQSAESDSAVHALWLTPVAGEPWVSLMPGMERVSFGAGGKDMHKVSVPDDFAPKAGMELTDGDYEAASFSAGNASVTVLYPPGGGTAAMVEWSALKATLAALEDITGSDPAANKDSDQKMEALLDSLGMLQGDETGAVSAPEKQNPYYGTEWPGAALGACKSAAEASLLADAMMTYWEYAERQTAMEENLVRTELLLTEAEAEAARGTGSEDTVSALREQKVILEGEIQRCATERAKAQLQAQGAGGPDLTGLDVSKLVLQFDPTALDVNELALIAAAYAQACGKESETEDVATRIREILLELTDAYGQMQTALGYYSASGERVQSAATAYATGSGTKADWYGAISTQAERRAALTAQIAAFSRAANKLNMLTGGWISRNKAWFDVEFNMLFSAAMLPSAGGPKAEEPKTEEPKTEEPKTEEPKTEEPKTEEPKTEEPKTEITAESLPRTEKTGEETHG